MGVDGVAAARTLLGYTNVRHGYCLYYVWQAYDAHGADTSLSAGTAYEAWGKSWGQHPGDRNPPAGVPVFWGPKAGSAAGDVVISLGGGRVAATDFPYYGQVNATTIDERERQIGRPYLGWTERIFDVEIDFAATSGGGSTPITPTSQEDEDMDFINVQGKAGSHRAGQFAIYRGNADRKLYARRITFDTMNPMFPTIDNEGLKNLQKAMPFIDLV